MRFSFKGFSNPDIIIHTKNDLYKIDLTGIKRILITGYPGSGKTTLAHSLGRFHIEVDKLYWLNQKGGAVNPKFTEELEMNLERPEWVVEGHFGKIKTKLRDKVELHIHLATPLALILWRLLIRDIKDFISQKRKSSDFLFLIKKLLSRNLS